MSNGPEDQNEDDAKAGVPDDASTPDDPIAIELPIEQGDADSQPS